MRFRPPALFRNWCRYGSACARECQNDSLVGRRLARRWPLGPPSSCWQNRQTRHQHRLRSIPSVLPVTSPQNKFSSLLRPPPRPRNGALHGATRRPRRGQTWQPSASRVRILRLRGPARRHRANAQLLTGPASEAGKAISSRNNFRHGLTQSEGDLVVLNFESKDEYNLALEALLQESLPATPT
jgi:hypothetical protein